MIDIHFMLRILKAIGYVVMSFLILLILSPLFIIAYTICIVAAMIAIIVITYNEVVIQKSYIDDVTSS